MSTQYADNLVAAHFNMFDAAEEAPEDTLTELEKERLARRIELEKSGNAYYELQMTKPFTIGLAIGSSPLAVLSWIGEKLYVWSDPKRVDPADIIDTVALYFLSGSFATSVMIYNQVRTECTYCLLTNLCISASKLGTRRMARLLSWCLLSGLNLASLLS